MSKDESLDFENTQNETSENFGDLWKEIDEALDTVLDAQDPTLQLSETSGEEQMKETFVQMCAQTLNPVCRYIKAISLGENSKEVLELSEMIVTALVPKIQNVGLREHHDDLVFFRSLLLLALGETDQHAVEKMKEVVMEGFEQIENRFGLEYRGYKLAVKNLVEFYRELKRNEFIEPQEVRNLFSVGIPSLTWVRRTRATELASLTGIRPEALTEIRKIAYLYHSGTNTEFEAAVSATEHNASIRDRRADDFVETDLPFLPPDLGTPFKRA